MANREHARRGDCVTQPILHLFNKGMPSSILVEDDSTAWHGLGARDIQMHHTAFKIQSTCRPRIIPNAASVGSIYGPHGHDASTFLTLTPALYQVLNRGLEFDILVQPLINQRTHGVQGVTGPTITEGVRQHAITWKAYRLM